MTEEKKQSPSSYERLCLKITNMEEIPNIIMDIKDDVTDISLKDLVNEMIMEEMGYDIRRSSTRPYSPLIRFEILRTSGGLCDKGVYEVEVDFYTPGFAMPYSRILKVASLLTKPWRMEREGFYLNWYPQMPISLSWVASPYNSDLFW